MKVLFDGTLLVDYGFVYLDCDRGAYDADVDQRAGQVNGLAGAAQPGFVLLTTGTSYGDVPVRVERHRSEPELDERWDEIVEVSCDFRGRRLWLSAFDHDAGAGRLRENGPHRVRYSALRFDDAREREDDQAPLDRYLVQLWPTPMAADLVVKQTSEGAAYWHGVAREATTPNPVAYDRASVEARDRAEREESERRSERERALWAWGGQEPSTALREVGPVGRLSIAHRDLVDRVEQLTPARQRELARTTARQACAADVQSPVDWTRALDALDADRPLPAPFDDEDAVMDLMFGPAAAREVVVEGSFHPVPVEPGAPVQAPRIHTGVSASAAVRAAAGPEPFAAALRTIEAGSWSAPDEQAYFAAIEALVG